MGLQVKWLINQRTTKRLSWADSIIARRSQRLSFRWRRSPATRGAGLLLFAFYLTFYVAFVLINAFRPAWMDTVLAGGINLAVWYGFALIGGALVVALIYGWLCRDAASEADAEAGR